MQQCSFNIYRNKMVFMDGENLGMLRFYKQFLLFSNSYISISSITEFELFFDLLTHKKSPNKLELFL